MPQKREYPETGDLVWTPRDAIQWGFVEALTSTGHLLVKSDGGHLRKVELSFVDAWFRPFWRRGSGADDQVAGLLGEGTRV